jgi:hypothetical protein
MTFIRLPSSATSLAIAALPLILLGCDSSDTPDDDGTSTSSSSATGSSSSSSSTGGGVGGGEPELPDACAETSRYLSSDGVEVTRCDALYPQRPFVHVPADVVDGDVHTIFGAYDPQRGIVRSSGETLLLVDANDATRPFPDATAPWAAPLHWPSSRVLVYVYEWRGNLTSVTVDGQVRPALRFLEARPAIFLPSEVIDGALLGAWEGRVAGRLPQPMGIFEFGLEEGAPIRVEYTALAPDPLGLVEWDVQDQSFLEGAKATVVGQIVNMTASVRGSDGTCIPALSDNPAIPFETATDGRLDITRIAAMHTPGDMVLAHQYPTGTYWAAGGGMSDIGPAHPAAFIQDAERPEWTEYAPFPHATPDGMQIEIRQVTGGGGPCN